METAEQLITEDLELWVSAVKAKSTSGRGSSKKIELYGISKLRGLILDLAVRGVLTLQESGDEPADALIERITKNKSNLVKQGKLKNTKRLPPVSAEQIPFKAPQNWSWARLGEVLIKITDGTHHSPPNSESGDYRYISAKNIKTDGVQLKNATWVSKEIHEEIYSRCDPEKGDILYIKDGATTGIVTINDLDEPFSMLSSVALLKPPEEVLSSYLLISLRSPYFYREMRSEMTGVAITRVTLKKLNSAFIPLPPLAEQHRIIAKVDELMTLCDQLEQEQDNNLKTHETLVGTLLNALTSADADASQFADVWQRINDNFDILFTTESSVDQLKQTILQLAVMGKLVKQNHEDEPADQLLKNITKEKESLAKLKMIGKQKQFNEVCTQDVPYSLPRNWTWCRLGQTGICFTGKTPKTSNCHHFGGSIQFIGPGQITQSGKLLEAEKTITESGLEESTEAVPGDILMVCIGGSIGKSAITDKRLAFNQQINSLRPIGLNAQYLNLAMTTNRFLQSVVENSTGSATPIINRTKWEKLLVPIPPLEEQHRIVAKGDELIALCDQLKAKLTQAQETQLTLADSLVEQAIQSPA